MIVIKFFPSNFDHMWLEKLFNTLSGMINLDISDHIPSFLQLYKNNNESNLAKTKIQFGPITQTFF